MILKSYWVELAVFHVSPMNSQVQQVFIWDLLYGESVQSVTVSHAKSPGCRVPG